jgi:hypothetical protein
LLVIEKVEEYPSRLYNQHNLIRAIQISPFSELALFQRSLTSPSTDRSPEAALKSNTPEPLG